METIGIVYKNIRYEFNHIDNEFNIYHKWDCFGILPIKTFGPYRTMKRLSEEKLHNFIDNELSKIDVNNFTFEKIDKNLQSYREQLFEVENKINELEVLKRSIELD
jgi:hypothetical protein